MSLKARVEWVLAKYFFNDIGFVFDVVWQAFVFLGEFGGVIDFHLAQVF